jgi:hypothetical protein
VSDVTTTRVDAAEPAGTAATPVAASAKATSAAVREIAWVGLEVIDVVRPFFDVRLMPLSLSRDPDLSQLPPEWVTGTAPQGAR